MNFPMPPDALDKDLVFEFFWKFSVFECALKREGYLKKGKGAAEPDWDEFGKFIHGKARMIGKDFLEAALELRKLSPRKQVNESQRLGWKALAQSDGESDEAYTIRLLTTVRNNLFHGGKYPDGPEFEVARDRKIIRAALAILDGCYELHPGIKGMIEEAAA